MRKRKLGSNVGFERLEHRRLLAADCGMQALPDSVLTEPTEFEVTSMECATAEAVAESTAEVVVDDSTTTPDADPRILDLSDGMDGYFGSINGENPSETIEFTAAADGMIDVVLTSSFGGVDAAMSITNSQGDVIEPRAAGVPGFDMSSFEVVEGETYQLSISGDGAKCEGHFQLTAAFQAHVDQHANEIGNESTELTMVDNSTKLSGRLESAGDIDTFRFTSPASGEITLELQETVDDSRIGLDVSVQDANGNPLADGATNESLKISFDAEGGQEYFISIAAGEGEKGTYQFGLNLELIAEPDTGPISESVVSDVVDETTDIDTGSDVIADDMTVVDDCDPPADDQSEPDVVAEEQPAAGVDAEVVETGDEIVDANPDDAAADVVENVEPVDSDDPVDCDDVDVVDAGIADPVVDQPTDEIADEPIADGSVDEIVDGVDDQTADDQQPVDEPVVVTTDDQTDDDLSGALVDCDGDESTDSDDSGSDGIPGADLATEPVAGDLIVSGGDETESDANSDASIRGLENLESVDNFFAYYGDQLELHFNFFFGFDSVNQIPSRG